TRVCPATVVFRGRIRSNASVSGTYRLVGSGGYASPAYPFSLASNGERSIASQRRVELPAGSGGLAAPGGGTWPRIVRGWLQLEVALTHPDARVLRSPQADYEVRCLKPPSPGGTLRN
ncbi:MAG TPA: hypothetical protein VNJ05_08960, partial [Sphingomicrobium sp.]|nr:hypothetical protein [Sphingomicrobium sp.]